MFPDTRQYLRCYPAFEAFRRFKFAAEDKRVETGFIDNSHFLGPAKVALNWGVLFIFVVYMYGYSISCLHILTPLPHLFLRTMALHLSQYNADFRILDDWRSHTEKWKKKSRIVTPSSLVINVCLLLNWCYITIITDRKYVRNRKLRG